MRHLITLFIFSFISSLSYSDTIVVPDDHPYIQGAMDAAVNGDTVLVKPGIYTANLDFEGKAITVKSSGGAEQTIIKGSVFEVISVVTFKSGEGIDSVLDGFTITDGKAFCSGGGIFCNNSSSPTIKNKEFHLELAFGILSCLLTGTYSPILL